MLILLWRPLAIGGGVQTGNVRTLGDYHAPSYNWPAPKRKDSSVLERKRRQVVEPVTDNVTEAGEVVTPRVITPPRRIGPRLRPLVPTKRRVLPSAFERAALVLLPVPDVVVLDAPTVVAEMVSDDPLMAMLLCVALDD